MNASTKELMKMFSEYDLYSDKIKARQLYHFSSLRSLLSIIESKTLQMSHYRDLNDQLEFVHGSNAIASSAKTTSPLRGLKKCADEIISLGGYIFSLSREYTNYHQWNAYAGKGSGASIRIDIDKLLKQLRENNVGMVFIPLNVQYKELDSKIDAHVKSLKSIPRDNRASSTKYITNHLFAAKMIWASKQFCFKDEKEVRIVAFPNHQDGIAEQTSFNDYGNPRHFISVSLGQRLDWIKEVTFGPKVQCESIELFKELTKSHLKTIFKQSDSAFL